MRVRADGDGSLLLGSFEIVTPRRRTTMTATTRHFETTASTATLFVSFELGEASWTLAFATERVKRPRKRTMGARDRVAVIREIERAKQHFGLPADTAVKSCYEAGREGFWLHRWLVSEGIDNYVVDASSIEVNRRLRRAKTDRMDATRLLWLLVRFFGGEWSVWSVPGGSRRRANHLASEHRREPTRR
jgi:transposase